MEPSGFFLQLLEREAAANRRVLERVPEGRNSWKPHERSMEMGSSQPWLLPCRAGLQ